LIVVDNVNSPITYNTFNINYTTKIGTEYFADLIKKTVKKATNSKSKTLILVPYVYLYTLTGLIEGLDKDRKTLLLYRGANIHQDASGLLSETFTQATDVLWPKQKLTFVNTDEEVSKLIKSQRVLDYHTDGCRGLFVIYDTIIIGVSHTRQASLFFSELEGTERPNIIAISSSDKPFVSPSVMQVTGRFRRGRPNVTVLAKVKHREDDKGNLIYYTLGDVTHHIVKNIDPNFDKYQDNKSELMLLDVTSTQKGIYRGKKVGKNVSEKTALIDALKRSVCVKIYYMLDTGKSVKDIIKSLTGENQVEGLTEDQTVRLIYDCAAGRTPKKFTRERLGL
jgi:hypothetical protein